ncbi:MAG TPA: hypothetical protein VKR30_08440 [Candidatus Limnocylindrales bacterium]|nr:hypothetical protein [Candidatus Limnocylindrales bacterium]
MAKRTRYDNRATGRRPAANRLARREPAKAKPIVIEPAATSAPSIDELEAAEDAAGLGAPAWAHGTHLTQAEIDRAAQLESEMTTRERALAAARQRATGAAGHHAALDVNAPLAVRASREYAYVARDVRRIIATAALMVAILAVIAILVNVVGVVQLG